MRINWYNNLERDDRLNHIYTDKINYILLHSKRVFVRPLKASHRNVENCTVECQEGRRGRFFQSDIIFIQFYVTLFQHIFSRRNREISISIARKPCSGSPTRLSLSLSLCRCVQPCDVTTTVQPRRTWILWCVLRLPYTTRMRLSDATCDYRHESYGSSESSGAYSATVRDFSPIGSCCCFRVIRHSSSEIPGCHRQRIFDRVYILRTIHRSREVGDRIRSARDLSLA